MSGDVAIDQSRGGALGTGSRLTVRSVHLHRPSKARMCRWVGSWTNAEALLVAAGLLGCVWPLD